MSTQTDAATAQSAPPPSVKQDTGSGLLFVVGAAVIACGLGILVAHAPEAIRLLGLFSVALGLLTGWLLANLANKLTLKLNWLRLSVIAVATVAELIIATCQTMALHPEPPKLMPHPITELVEAQLRRDKDSSLPESDPTTPAAIPLQPHPSDGPTPEPAPPVVIPPPPPISKRPAMKMPVAMMPTEPRPFAQRFQSFLVRRVDRLKWTSPWPELFWLTELIVAAGGSVWLAIRCRPQEPPQ